MIRANQLLVKQLAVTSNATPGARSTFAHGLTTTPLLQHCEVWCTGANDDVSSVPSATVTAVDGTNVTVKCNMPSISMVIKIWRNRDDVGRPANQ